MLPLHLHNLNTYIHLQYRPFRMVLGFFSSQRFEKHHVPLSSRKQWARRKMTHIYFREDPFYFLCFLWLNLHSNTNLKTNLLCTKVPGGKQARWGLLLTSKQIDEPEHHSKLSRTYCVWCDEKNECKVDSGRVGDRKVGRYLLTFSRLRRCVEKRSVLGGRYLLPLLSGSTYIVLT